MSTFKALAENIFTFIILGSMIDQIPCFILKPNFHILSKYFSYSHSAEELQKEYADGYIVLVDWLYTDELVKSVKDGFRIIVENYGLEAHHDNLLMLALEQLNLIESRLTELHLQNEKQLRTKQLAELLLAYKDAEERTYTSLSFKTTSKFKNVKVDDKKTIKWILAMVHDGIRDGQFGTIGDIEWGIEGKFFDETATGKVLNTDKLKFEASNFIESYKKKVKAYYADFCLHLYTYLDGETNIRPNKETLLSDNMLNFFYQLLVLVEFINPDSIDSEPKDYVSTLIRNRLKTLNS